MLNARTGEEGVALVVAAMAMMLLLALGAALVLLSSSETMIAASFRASGETFYAADAVLEYALSDLRATPDWNAVLDGSVRSSFVDGPSSGTRRQADGTVVDFGQVVSLADCQKTTPCRDDDMSAVTRDRPWGPNNLRWRPFAFGVLAEMVGADALESSCYVMALVADDPSENDGDPFRDGESRGGRPNPGRGVLTLRGEAFGARGSHKIVEATVQQVYADGEEAGVPTGIRVLSWRELR
jgi:hypothetical protein